MLTQERFSQIKQQLHDAWGRAIYSHHLTHEDIHALHVVYVIMHRIEETGESLIEELTK